VSAQCRQPATRIMIALNRALYSLYLRSMFYVKCLFRISFVSQDGRKLGLCADYKMRVKSHRPPAYPEDQRLHCTKPKETLVVPCLYVILQVLHFAVFKTSIHPFFCIDSFSGIRKWWSDLLNNSSNSCPLTPSGRAMQTKHSVDMLIPVRVFGEERRFTASVNAFISED
jgi:hypothetical protein